MSVLSGFFVVAVCLLVGSVQAASINGSANATASKPIDRIVGGVQVPIEDAPYLVALIYMRKFTCGGSIISESKILTAGHCVRGRIASRFVARVGSSVHNDGGTLVKIKRITLHPNFDSYTLDYDFAIMTLLSSLTFSEGVKPIPVTTCHGKLTEQNRGYVFGWGTTGYNKPVSPMLRGVLVPIIPTPVCNQSYKGELTDRMFCAGYAWGGQDACQGDSGGPLVDERLRVVIGVVSWGNGCAMPNYAGIYANVSAVKEWIHETY